MVTAIKKRNKAERRQVRGLGQELAALRKSRGVKNRRLLVVNRNYQPITTTPLFKAMNKVFKGTAVILLPPGDDSPVWQEMSWDDWADLKPKEGEDVLQAIERVFRIPEIIKAVDYSDNPNRQVKLSRRAIYRRDKFQCQYCGKKPSIEELSIDHVIPKAQGGKTTWDNVVVACIDCNQRRKDNKTPEQAGMKLLKQPRMPEYDVLQGRIIRVDSWQHFLGDCYWLIPLKED